MSVKGKPSKAGKSPFGDLLIHLRTQHGLTQEGLSSATGPERISSRSITNYEKGATDARNWILPHRPALQTLSNAMNLDSADRRRLAEAWKATKALKEANTPSRKSSDFVTSGREKIVATILESWERARNGDPQFVMLGGDSGIGKTSIARHVCDLIAESTNEVMITWGEAHSWASPVQPYVSMRHATDRMLIPPPENFALPGRYPNRPKITDKHIDRVMKSFPQLGEVLISEATIRRLVAQSDRHRDEEAEALILARSETESSGRWEEYASFISDMAQSFPIVMVLEDLHWTTDFVSSLLQYLAYHLGKHTNVPLLIICTYRSNELIPKSGTEPHPFARLFDAIAHLPSTVAVHMNESLTPQNGKSFITSLLADQPMASAANHQELVDWLYERTSGQPMMTRETMRQLRESDGLAQVPGTALWQFDRTRVPQQISTATSTLMAQRVNQVDRRGRYILEIAAAMGEIVLPEVLADVLKTDEESLLAEIDELLVDRHEMLEQGPDFTVGHSTYSTYRFPHALLREYIYSETRATTRRRIHSQIAESLSQHFSDTNSEAMGEITHHYVMAEDWHSAQMTAYRMAQIKAGRLDWDLALVWFDQAEELSLRAEDAQQLWRARASRLMVMRGLNQYDEAIALSKRIIKQAEFYNWAPTLALTYHHIGEVYYDLGQLDRSVESVERALEIHIQENESDLAAAAQAMLSHATYRQGKYDVARKHAHHALDHTRDNHNSWVRSEALLAAANCDIDMGYYREAIESYEAAIELASMSGKLSNQVLPALNIGLSYIMLDEYDIAMEKIQETMTLLAQLRVPRITAWGHLYRGFALEGKADLEGAMTEYTTSVSIRREREQPPVLYDSIAAQLSVATKLGDKEAARGFLTEIMAHVDVHGLDGVEDMVLVLLTLAKGFRFLGNEDEYWRQLEKAHDIISGRAAVIEDKEATHSYLTRVPTNAEVQRRFSERAKG